MLGEATGSDGVDFWAKMPIIPLKFAACYRKNISYGTGPSNVKKKTGRRLHISSWQRSSLSVLVEEIKDILGEKTPLTVPLRMAIPLSMASEPPSGPCYQAIGRALTLILVSSNTTTLPADRRSAIADE